jgi:hypothetical protein
VGEGHGKRAAFQHPGKRGLLSMVKGLLKTRGCGDIFWHGVHAGACFPGETQWIIKDTLKRELRQSLPIMTLDALGKRREKASQFESQTVEARFATRQAGSGISPRIGKLFRARC